MGCALLVHHHCLVRSCYNPLLRSSANTLYSFSGWTSLLHGEFSASDFFSAYINIPFVFILYFGYKFVKKTKIVPLMEMDVYVPFPLMHMPLANVRPQHHALRRGLRRPQQARRALSVRRIPCIFTLVCPMMLLLHFLPTHPPYLLPSGGHCC